MTDSNAFERFVAQHLADDGSGTAHAERIAALINEQTRDRRQLPRWLALIDDTIAYRPSLIPAANGHHPTRIGRTTSMFDIARAVTAGALILALGGTLFVVQPSSRQGGGAPGAETDAMVAEPVAFTVRFSWLGHQLREAEHMTEGGLTRSIGSCHAMAVVDPSDPRIDGDLTFCSDEHVYGENRDASTIVWTDTYRIVNDDGAWQGSHDGVVWDDPGSGERWEAGGDLLILAGEGAYEGLYAAITFPGQWSEGGHGFIFEGLPPADPVPPAAE